MVYTAEYHADDDVFLFTFSVYMIYLFYTVEIHSSISVNKDNTAYSVFISDNLLFKVIVGVHFSKNFQKKFKYKNTVQNEKSGFRQFLVA